MYEVTACTNSVSLWSLSWLLSAVKFWRLLWNSVQRGRDVKNNFHVSWMAVKVSIWSTGITIPECCFAVLYGDQNLWMLFFSSLWRSELLNVVFQFWGSEFPNDFLEFFMEIRISEFFYWVLHGDQDFWTLLWVLTGDQNFWMFFLNCFFRGIRIAECFLTSLWGSEVLIVFFWSSLWGSEFVNGFLALYGD